MRKCYYAHFTGEQETRKIKVSSVTIQVNSAVFELQLDAKLIYCGPSPVSGLRLHWHILSPNQVLHSLPK